MSREDIAVIVAVVAAFSAGWGFAAARFAPKLATLLAQVEIARQTGQLHEKRAVLDALREPRSLASALTSDTEAEQDSVEAQAEQRAREAAVAKGTEELMADARRNGIPLSPAEARRMAADMVAEVL